MKALAETFREGDFIETKEGFIFDVKGLVHPPNSVVAYIRYVPDCTGSRNRNGTSFRKIYELSDRYSFLRRRAPEYLVHDVVFDEEMIEVPRTRIARHYEPLTRTRELLRNARTALERKSIEMITILASASSTSAEEFGISGSVLVGLAGPVSDIDIIVYGNKRSQGIRKVLRALLKEDNSFKAYGEEKLRKLFESRHEETGIPFGDYVRCEARKDFQGYFKGTDFFVRYVKDVHEVNEEYGSIIYRALGRSRLEATVTGDKEAIFTPCTYQIKDISMTTTDVMPPKEIVSFRGQFCEQARVGEKVAAQGKIEQLSKKNRTWNRMLLGSARTDFMIAYHSGCGDG